MNIIESLKSVPDANFAQPNNILEIQEAEKALGIHFPIEYVDMLLQTGALKCPLLSACSVGVGSYHNVVDQTIQQRVKHGIPKEYFVLEQPPVDGIVLLQREDGQIFEFDNGQLKFLECSLSAYISKLSSLSGQKKN